MENEMNIRIENVKVGDYLNEMQFYKVASKSYDRISVMPEQGTEITIANSIVEGHMYSASHFDRVRYVTQTQMIARFQSIQSGIFQVKFLKKPKTKDIVDTMLELLESQEGVMMKYLAGIMIHGDDDDLEEFKGRFAKFIKNWPKDAKVFKREAKKSIKLEAEGVERTLVGYKYYKEYAEDELDDALLESTIDTGMTKVIDLEVPSEKYRIRQIRHDGIQELITKNIKYIVGKEPKK